MLTVMVFGTFDILHAGHKNFFVQARKHGARLIAVAARDKTVLEIKGKMPQNGEQERLTAILSCGLVDLAVLGELSNKYAIIKKYIPEVICLGYDQNSFTKNLREKLDELYLQNTKIIRLKPYKEDIYKSSKFKNC